MGTDFFARVVILGVLSVLTVGCAVIKMRKSPGIAKFSIARFRRQPRRRRRRN